MKKFRTIIALVLATLSFGACDNGSSKAIDFDILETKNIVLGNQVDSVEFTTKEGKEMTFTKENEFYEIFDEIGYKSFENETKYSCHGEMKIGEQSKSLINMNMYTRADAMLIEARAKTEDSNDVALIEEYSHHKQLENNAVEYTSFVRYLYKDEKAFGGSVSNTIYSSENYPMIPKSGTKLCEMQSRALGLSNFLYSTSFFVEYGSTEETDFEKMVTREYTLYENYIVFKQTAPFINVISGAGEDLELFYRICLGSTSSATQEAYCNVKTGEIELIKVYGDPVCHMPQYIGRPFEIDMQMYIHSYDTAEYQQKINKIIDYVKSNAD